MSALCRRILSLLRVAGDTWHSIKQHYALTGIQFTADVDTRLISSCDDRLGSVQQASALRYHSHVWMHTNHGCPTLTVQRRLHSRLHYAVVVFLRQQFLALNATLQFFQNWRNNFWRQFSTVIYGSCVISCRTACTSTECCADNVQHIGLVDWQRTEQLNWFLAESQSESTSCYCWNIRQQKQNRNPD